MSKVLKIVGLTPDQVKLAALRFGSTEADRTRRNFATMVKKGSRGRGGLPEYVIEAMYADYQRIKSLSKVGALYGRTRQAMWEIFHSQNLPMQDRNFHQKVLFDGSVFTPGKNGYLRATTPPRDPLHHRIWVKKYGPIPAGHQVYFKDGININFAPDNLACAPIGEVTAHHQRRLHPSACLSPEDRIARRKKVSLDYYYRKSRKFLEKGLTVQGQPRARQASLTPEQRTNYNRAKSITGYRQRRDQFAQQGLTSRGTERTYRPRKALPQNEQAWREFRSTLGVNTPPDFYEHAYKSKWRKQ